MLFHVRVQDVLFLLNLALNINSAYLFLVNLIKKKYLVSYLKRRKKAIATRKSLVIAIYPFCGGQEFMYSSFLWEKLITGRVYSRSLKWMSAVEHFVKIER